MARALRRAEPPSMLALIARAAHDPSVDIEKMRALLDMQRGLMADQARQEFADAFKRLQPLLPRVTKKGEVKYPVDKNKPDGPQKKAFNYARYEDIDEAVSPLLNAEGFRLSYDSQPLSDGRITIVGTLHHVGGHEKTATVGPLPLDTSGGKNNVQAVGSTVSYGKRYTMTMLLNLVFEGEDDDGVRGGEERITEAQIRDLSNLIRETKSDLDSFLRFVEVETLADIVVQDYPKAINALMAKKRKAQNPAGQPNRPAPAQSPARGVANPDEPETATLSFAVAPQKGRGRGIDWKATKEMLMDRAALIKNPDDFDRLHRESGQTIELLRRADHALWSAFKFESGQMEGELRREKL